MKNVRKLIAVSLVIAMICAFTACGTSNKNSTDDMAGNTSTTTENGTTGDNAAGGTVDNGTTENGTDDNMTGNDDLDGTVDTDNVNDATAGTGSDGNSILDDAGNAVGDVVDDIANGVSDLTDDMVGDTNQDNDNNAQDENTTNSDNVTAKANHTNNR